MAKITLNLPSLGLRAIAVKSTATALSLTKGIRTSVSNFAHDVQEEVDKPTPDKAESDENSEPKKSPFDFVRRA